MRITVTNFQKKIQCTRQTQRLSVFYFFLITVNITNFDLVTACVKTKQKLKLKKNFQKH